ncbi:MAG: DMT family transporter [Anaerolineales bacterium]|jgi:drug/metabolite transporter (DMT)-like permease
MKRRNSTHLIAVLQALLVTLLWSTSWILVKFGLRDLPALTFAGLRYGLSSLILLPLALRQSQRQALAHLGLGGWLRLGVLGLFYYTLTQGTQFLGLTYLPATTFSLLLSFTPILVALLSLPILREKLSPGQWLGTGIYLAGLTLFTYPWSDLGLSAIGLVIGSLSVIANAISSILGRYVNREGKLDAVTVTAVSMTIGSALLLGAGVTVEPLPRLNLSNWMIVGWLAVVNGAFAFALWNHTLRTLQAVESSLINNTMLYQIAVLAWIFLDERLTGLQIAALVVAGAGVTLAQIRQNRAVSKP